MKKLHKTQMISKLGVNTPLSAITLLLRNFIANFVRIHEICKTFAGNSVNQLRNIPRRVSSQCSEPYQTTYLAY